MALPPGKAIAPRKFRDYNKALTKSPSGRYRYNENERI